MRFDVTAAVLLETAAFTLVLIGRAPWTDQAVTGMFTASVLCWITCGMRLMNRRLRGISENTC